MIPTISALNLPQILHTAKQLPLKGSTVMTDNGLFCLKIDDNYIHQLYPFLQDNKIQKPPYFGEKSIGAHITIAYAEEHKIIHKNELQKEHYFFINDIVSAEIGNKTYYVLLVESLSLLTLRRKYHLPDLLCFRGYSIGFRITIGVKITLNQKI